MIYREACIDIIKNLPESALEEAWDYLVSIDEFYTERENHESVEKLKQLLNDIPPWGEQEVIKLKHIVIRDSELYDIIKKISESLDKTDEEVVLAGINLVRLAIKARESGQKLVVVDENGTIMTEVSGI